MNKTLHKFTCKLVENLKMENGRRKCQSESELDIPFIISSLYQSFTNDEGKYKDFIYDLENWNWYSLSIINSGIEWNGIIDISIYNYGSKHSYLLRFFYDERNYGYCQCTPDMPDYRKDKKCCGHGCDADFSEFELSKVTPIATHSWQGDEHDYWLFEDSFYEKEKSLLEEKIKEDKRREVEKLKADIESSLKRLRELGESL